MRVRRGANEGVLPGLSLLAGVVCLLLPIVSAQAAATMLRAQLIDQKGKPVEAGVVVATPADGTGRAAGRDAVMDQIEEAFVPEVLPVMVGTAVEFPNQDDIRHHVYSFSDAKKFELPLYKGTPADPVVFDTAGEVVLGCNIHDHMRGYILVVDSPYFGTTDKDGVVELRDLPDGGYDVRAWHPRQKISSEPTSVEIAGSSVQVEFSLELKPALRLRGSSTRGKKY